MHLTRVEPYASAPPLRPVQGPWTPAVEVQSHTTAVNATKNHVSAIRNQKTPMPEPFMLPSPP